MSASLEISQLIQKLATAAASLEISCRPDQLIQKNSENSEHFPNQLASFKTTQLIKTIYSELFSSSKLTKGGHHLKKRYILGIFPKWRTPTPFGNPLVEKFFMVYFAFQAIRSNFVFLKKVTFGWYFSFQIWEQGTPPPPFWENFPKNTVFYF